MSKLLLSCCAIIAISNAAANAACTADNVMEKAAAISDVLSSKLQSKAEDASKMMNEMGQITGDGSVTDQTCTKLDDLMARAKKL